MLLILAGLLSAFAACGAPQKTEEQQVAAQETKEDLITVITKRGTMRVGLSVFVPWSFKDKDGVLRGFEIDVASKLAEDLGIKVEFVPTEWSGLIPALLTGKFDVIIAGMGIVPERAMKVNFTIPYDYSGMSMNASKKLAPGWYNLEDFNKPNVIISVRLGTTAVDAVKKFFPKAQLRQFDNEAECEQEVINGKAHAVVASAPEPEAWVNKHPNELYLPLKGKTFTQEPISFALRRGDPDALAFFNAWITLKQWEGWLEEKHQYWFVGSDWNKSLEQ
ncbi:MAG: transporter substrate-binding domain-containing protein [Spirochaetota bacterium]